MLTNGEFSLSTRIGLAFCRNQENICRCFSTSQVNNMHEILVSNALHYLFKKRNNKRGKYVVHIFVSLKSAFKI